MSFFPVSSPLIGHMPKQEVEVLARGDLVVLKIGNSPIYMGYEQALDLSRWMRIEARIVKSLTRNRGRTIRSLGIIHDAGFKPKPLPHTPGPGIIVKQKLQIWNRRDVTSEGRLIAVKLGPHTFKTHYENALKLSQWLRVRAKEAMRNAGDTDRHWSEVGSDCES